MNELARHQQYLKDRKSDPSRGCTQQHSSNKTDDKRGDTRGFRQCYECGSTDHLAKNCKRKKTELTGQTTRSSAKMVNSQENPLNFLHSDSDSESSDIRTVRIQSKPREVIVNVQGVPATGVIDSGANITIMGAELFKKVLQWHD